jgi:CRISPR/Cas system-associated exonuclease Cas4 (RecB family)
MSLKPNKNILQAPFTFSQSSLQDYNDCNRRFQLRYIEQLKWPAVESAPVLENERRQIEGQQFHRMVQQYLLGLPVDKLTHMAENSESPDLARWWQNFLSPRTGSLVDLDGSKFFPEQSLSAPSGSHRLTAKYDLIAVKDGKATIYDWKTSHRRPKDEWMAVRFQTRVYPALLVIAGAHLNHNIPFKPEEVKMVYWYADFPEEPARIPYNQKLFKRDRSWLNDVIKEISARQSFPLTEDEKTCGFCPYRSYCERGVSAAEGEELETEMNLNDWDVKLEQVQEIEF